ncbi:UDP-N-acetylmuramoyl-L-alanyl-D-glutamate--2,6-diaminopimelate ligase [Candidatus Planktophila versatilis]|nr:UDP-N-acetylmuramoyl-L-alanyl-D-glutamate--2,6-diaminopimelate ligase [Candidatus Planktophila versatilis]
MIRPLANFSLNLSEVAQLVSAENTEAIKKLAAGIEITGVVHSDSEVEAGDIFLAIPGTKVHGANFIAAAVARGAVAVVTDVAGAALTSTLPTLVVKDVRSAGAMIASSLYKDPTRDLATIGITGTNGKTTVSTLLYQLFAGAGRESGLIGTIETRIGSEVLKSVRTTPEAPELQALSAVMRERHMRAIVMEVSSHALSMNRVKASHFAIVGFTNLSQDHLDFHKDMESYFAAKAKLFTYEYADLGFINIDNEYGARLAAQCEIPVVTLSRSNSAAQWHFTAIHTIASGAEISIRGNGGILIESKTSLLGGYNLDNLLMAVAIAHESGIDPVEIAALIPALTGAPGRVEPISLGQNFTALVDYAHSPDAVEKVLAAAREFTSGKVIAVLGCGGDRDATKRPLMGQALASGSDVAIFTSDNPRSESPAEILRQMTSKVDINEPSKIIEDRLAAITYAVNLASVGDTVLILGKGHEMGQEVAGVITPFDDRLTLAQAIEAKK